ncbi:DUF1642 domain-containing protein [Streptococcus gallolyticus]|uniref:DUF1642 domain-containing protein n=1 Tax=Streptococcus gallolyticus TaxID=315405 RepID=A0A1H9QHL2_9STRE|nr:DUF1642 domain-containing protein [Streptococcus gallolyticus]SER60006.1 Protein of unknown function [Streptococcus gallolyticus]
MNKKEIIDELEYNQHPLASSQEEIEWNNALDLAIDIIKEELDEPEKPIVPQYVADYIDSEQYSCSTLSEALDNMDDEKRILDWFYVNPETFAKAWIYGYEVEKEKLYTVELPNHNSDGSIHIILIKTEEGICIDCYSSISYRNLSIAQLTEAEIKKDFDWAWQFAEEVEK